MADRPKTTPIKTFNLKDKIAEGSTQPTKKYRKRPFEHGIPPTMGHPPKKQILNKKKKKK